MKKIFFLFIVSILLLQGCTNDYNGVKIRGKVRNSNMEYVCLSHLARLRGNLNSDDFRSIGTRIDRKGNFTLISDKLIDAASYIIQVNDKAFELVLFKGDNIELEFDYKDFDNTLFASGKGAGKINVLQLAQFNSNIWFDTKYSMDSYKSLIDSTINSQLSLLNLIYYKDINSQTLNNTENKEAIIKIINKTPVSKSEYDFLKMIISIRDISTLGNFSNFISEHGKLDNLKLDFSNPYFSCYNQTKYLEFENINFWLLESCITSILQVEYLKYLQIETNQLNNNSQKSDYLKFWEWSLKFAKEHFNHKVFDTYFASLILNNLSMGGYKDKTYEIYLNSCTDKKHLSAINRYIDLLDNGLSDSTYNLSNQKFALDSILLDSLINSYRGKDLYLVIWSAKYARSSIISGLPSIKDFAIENQGKIETLFICIDYPKYKNLWATHIIDNSWNGNHFFISADDNEKVIKKFAAQNIFSFCNGGVTYSFIDEEGCIVNGIESPMLLTNEKIAKYSKNTLR